MKSARAFVLGVLSFLVLHSVAGANDLRTLRPGHRVKLLTQNLYIGADVFRLLQADTPEEIPFIVSELFQTIVDSDFPERAAALAELIRWQRPDLIAVQEAVLIARLTPTVPPQFQVLDYLGELLAALAARGLKYQVVAAVNNTDITLPAFNPFAPGGLDFVRLIDRDAILALPAVQVSRPDARNYAAFLEIPTPGGPLRLLRGFTAVDARVRGESYRLVNTHLEVKGEQIHPSIAFVQAAQAHELILRLSGERLPILLVGDFNSSPVDPVIPPLIPPYVQLRAAGYVDVWERRIGPADPGFTCCQEETLMNPESILDQRIDLVFARNRFPFFPVIGPVFAEVIGEEPEDKTPSGLWASDHAGVFGRLRIPRIGIPE